MGAVLLRNDGFGQAAGVETAVILATYRTKWYCTSSSYSYRNRFIGHTPYWYYGEVLVCSSLGSMCLRLKRGLTVRDVQAFFGFEEPQAVYKWQSGKSLPTVDNLYALSALLDVRMDEILVAAKPELKIAETEPQAEACGSIICIVCFAGVVIERLVEFDGGIVN